MVSVVVSIVIVTEIYRYRKGRHQKFVHTLHVPFGYPIGSDNNTTTSRTRLYKKQWLYKKQRCPFCRRQSHSHHRSCPHYHHPHVLADGHSRVRVHDRVCQTNPIKVQLRIQPKPEDIFDPRPLVGVYNKEANTMDELV